MDKDEMYRRIEHGEDPLEIAIKKWEEIAAGKGFSEYSSNCALCQVHWMEPCINSKGEECPVKIAGFSSCLGSPYSEWNDHHAHHHQGLKQRVRCTWCREIANKEVLFLKSLRVNKEVKEDDL